MVVGRSYIDIIERESWRSSSGQVKSNDGGKEERKRVVLLNHVVSILCTVSNSIIRRAAERRGRPTLMRAAQVAATRCAGAGRVWNYRNVGQRH